MYFRRTEAKKKNLCLRDPRIRKTMLHLNQNIETSRKSENTRVVIHDDTKVMGFPVNYFYPIQKKKVQMTAI